MSVFLDSNVVLYATDIDSDKRRRSLALLDDRATVSVQVLNEIANVLRRKHEYNWDRIRSFTTDVTGKCDVVPLTVTTHERGLRYAARHMLSLYDALIVASAVLAGCDTLYSEDMHDGLVIDRLTIRNPFQASER